MARTASAVVPLRPQPSLPVQRARSRVEAARVAVTRAEAEGAEASAAADQLYRELIGLGDLNKLAPDGKRHVIDTLPPDEAARARGRMAAIPGDIETNQTAAKRAETARASAFLELNEAKARLAEIEAEPEIGKAIEDAEAAEAIEHGIIAKIEAAGRQAASLQAEKIEAAFEAHARGDVKAAARLDEINTTLTRLDRETTDLQSALSRVRADTEAKRAAVEAKRGERALVRAREIAGTLLAEDARIDEIVAELSAAMVRRRAHVEALSRSGCRLGNQHPANLLLSRRLLGALAPLADHVELGQHAREFGAALVEIDGPLIAMLRAPRADD